MSPAEDADVTIVAGCGIHNGGSEKSEHSGIHRFFLDKGATAISSEFHLNDFFAQMITGIILFFILGCEFFIHYRLVFRKGNKAEEKGV